MVRSLAHLCGRKLVELPVTSMTDTSDLLGGYEHVRVLNFALLHVYISEA